MRLLVTVHLGQNAPGITGCFLTGRRHQRIHRGKVLGQFNLQPLFSLIHMPVTDLSKQDMEVGNFIQPINQHHIPLAGVDLLMDFIVSRRADSEGQNRDEGEQAR